MFKRLFWTAVGVGLGFGLSVWMTRAMKRTAQRYTPEQVITRMGDALVAFGQELREAVREGREAMAEREAELRSEFETRAPAAEAPWN
ncbi:MAG TPA: hypothetical protein VM618_12480 [Acidimicrobiia bacterium]|nr:hypothetical protein [Acidimicrobiia bacterium]